MYENKNFKQRVWVYTIMLLIILSFFAFILLLNIEMQLSSNNDDIWGSNLDLEIGIVFAAPYFLSLTVLLHCGYVCFKPTLFCRYRCLHYIAIALSLLTVLAYWIMACWFLIVFSNQADQVDSLVPMIAFERTFATCFFASCIGFAFDLIGTKILSRQTKDSLS